LIVKSLKIVIINVWLIVRAEVDWGRAIALGSKNTVPDREIGPSLSKTNDLSLSFSLSLKNQ